MTSEKKTETVPANWTGVKARRRRKPAPSYFPVLLASLILGSILLLFLICRNTRLHYEKRYMTAEEAGLTTDSTAETGDWSEQPLYVQYPSFSFSGLTYEASSTEIPVENAGDYLGGITMSACYLIDGDTPKSVVSVYSISGVSRQCAVAVSFTGAQEYAVYLSTTWNPETLRDLYDGLCMEDAFETGTVYYYLHDRSGALHDVRFDGATVELVRSALFSDLNLVNDAGSDHGEKVMEVRVSIPSLGIENASVWTTSDGWLCTDLLSIEKAFYIGEDRVKDFTKLIRKNCDGYEVILTDSDAE